MFQNWAVVAKLTIIVLLRLWGIPIRLGNRKWTVLTVQNRLLNIFVYILRKDPISSAILYLSTGFCTCTEGYTLMEGLQDCIQFSDNGKNIYNNVIIPRTREYVISKYLKMDL